MSELEDKLLFQITACGLPEPVREYKAIPQRRFRWDFAWPAQKLLVEVNGGTWGKGGHSTGTGIARDYEKNNLANLAGYRCLIFTGAMVESGEAVDTIAKCLEVKE
jgi:very-short-patch-repair endonuclease